MIPADVEALVKLRLELENNQLPEPPRTRLLAEQALTLARMLGPDFFLSMLQHTPEYLSIHFEDGELVAVHSSNWRYLKDAPEEGLPQATPQQVVATICNGPLSIHGTPSPAVRDDTPLEPGQLRFLFGTEPPRVHRFRRLLRKAIRDPHLFLRDSRFAPLRWLVRN